MRLLLENSWNIFVLAEDVPTSNPTTEGRPYFRQTWCKKIEFGRLVLRIFMKKLYGVLLTLPARYFIGIGRQRTSELRQVERNEEMFVRKYGPRFRLVLESVSEKIYEARGVSESEVAVTLHK